MKMEKGAVAAAPMSWWRPDNYARVVEISADKEQFVDTFEEWRESAQELFNEIQKQGLLAVKVMVDPEELLAWATSEGYEINSSTRSQFAVLTFERQNRERH